MKKTLMSMGLLGTLIGTPVIYSAITAANTNDYTDFHKVENFKPIDANSFRRIVNGKLNPNFSIKNQMILRNLDFRNHKLFDLFHLNPEVLTHPKKNNFGELKIIPNQRQERIVQGKKVKDNCDILRNDIYEFYLFGDYKKLFNINELKNVFQELVDNMVSSYAPNAVSGVYVDFSSEKGARSVAGNAVNGGITVSVNMNDTKTAILNKIYYVTYHEFMHVETFQGKSQGLEGNLLTDVLSQVPEPKVGMQKIGRQAMRIYGEVTGREKMGDLGQSLLDNPYQKSSINNVYVGNILGFGMDTMSGKFDSEVTHLYTNPIETIVEDIISMTMGGHRSKQLNSEYTGLLGSLGYRIGQGVSLLNVENRAEVNMKILQNLFDSVGLFRPNYNAISRIVSGLQATKQNNRTKIGFYSIDPIDMEDNLRVTINGNASKVYETKLKNYETNVFMRTTPFSEEVIRYHINYHQFIIETTDEITSMHVEFNRLQNASMNETLKELFNNHPVETYSPSINQKVARPTTFIEKVVPQTVPPLPSSIAAPPLIHGTKRGKQ